MGVYCDVNVCIQSPTALAADARARVVELCIAHELLLGACDFAVPASPPLRSAWQRVRALWQKPASVSTFASAGLNAYGRLARGASVAVVASDVAGAWLPERARGAADFIVACGAPRWRGESVDGGFAYLAVSAPVPVHSKNAYRGADERSPFQAPDGLIGSFFDVLTLSSKHNLDGRIMASSSFVKALKRELGLKLTCRASWW
ncbi:MAG TPA: hypothetical protein VGO62_05405 [Myxococcota bacterium]|jgi:hypothetical protein